MTIANNIKIFLIEKLKEVDRKNFADDSGILYNTLTKIIKEDNLTPDLCTLLDIAKSSNCTLDEITGRTNYYLESKNYKFKNISWDEVNNNLRKFIDAKVEEKKLNNKKFTFQKLSKELGYSANTIALFIKGTHKSLSTAVIIALADYSEISIDEMIGRVSTSNRESKTLEKAKTE